MVKQDALLDAINEHVMRVLHLALDRGLLDAALERKVRGCGKLPMKALQAFVLTSSAFLGLSDEDAADAMDVSVQSLRNARSLLRTKYPALMQFESAWACQDKAGSLHHPFDITRIDETTIKCML